MGAFDVRAKANVGLKMTVRKAESEVSRRRRKEGEM